MKTPAVQPTALDFVWVPKITPSGLYYKALYCTACVERCGVLQGPVANVVIASGMMDPVCGCCKRRGYPTPPRGGPRLN